MLGGSSNQKYNPTLRSFALTLSFFSPRAYQFVRNTFNKSLPHLGTISKWYRSINGSAGFTEEALAALTLRQRTSSHPIFCNLVMDEMSIRRQIEWTGTKFTGYVDIGTNLDGDSLPEAREVLVFMVVCLNGSWKVPVGYFLLDGLSATEKSELVKRCLEFIYESGVIITSLTFDGAPVNLTMAEKLGADFTNPAQLKTWFKHPKTNADIFIFLDPSHMIKLVRNCFASQNDLKDCQKRQINWQFIKNLVETQCNEGLHAATKIRMRHLHWEREKMKVRLATQTISKSVSDAISFLREDLKIPAFQDSEGTTDFILNFNNIFDILNSRNRFAKYLYKRPLSPKTASHFLQYMESIKEYILGLTLKNISILKSPRKTGFLGFIICIDSLIKLYKLHVTEKNNLMYILTYKLSQDHLELFFGTVRSKGGYNNNPTARQFEATYKRLLIHSEISGPNTGNALNLEHLTILTCGSGSKISLTEIGNNLEDSEEYRSLLQEIKDQIENEKFVTSNAWDLTIYVNDVVAYISGFVVRSLQKCITCSKCSNLLQNDKSMSLLQNKKRYGQLVNASQMVISICRSAEKYFKFFNITNNIFNTKIKNLMDVLITNTMRILPLSVFDSFGDHMYDEDTFGNHATCLLKMILKNYFNIRIHYETMKNLDLSKKARLRSINTKTILFKNE